MSAQTTTTSDKTLDDFTQNIATIAEQSKELIETFIKNTPLQSDNHGSMPTMSASQISAANAFSEMLSSVALNPEKYLQMQFDFYTQYMELLSNTTARMMGENIEPIYPTKKNDKRFKDEAWNENAIFDFIRQSYFLTSKYLEKSVSDVDNIDKETSEKLSFYTKQYVDAMSPTNFFATNPEVLKETIKSNGKNLLKGLENLLKDLKDGNGQLKIKMADKDAFKIGKDIAATKGKIIYQNDLMQLIQYAPQTEKVYKTPLLVISPWINKYYILDMKKEKSLINWLVEQGHTVFVTSWVNPTADLSEKKFEDYMLEGPLAAIDAIEKATGEKQINAIGYCLGGTLMATTLSYLQKKGRSDTIKSITYLTTLVDFSAPGDLGVFIDELQVDEMEKNMRKKGYLDGKEMSLIFSMLRANDLIWSFAVNNYLLGRDAIPFDLLYWNADSTAMPTEMHIYYLRNMYIKNLLIKKNALNMVGEDIDISKIDTPTYILSAQEDHIAPWKSTYAATQIYKGSIRFVLSGSGHVAGVINPPFKEKYGYKTTTISDNYPTSPDSWLENTTEHKGSWWLDWQKWITENNYTGDTITARKVGGGKLKPIEDAPGSYVLVRHD